MASPLHTQCNEWMIVIQDRNIIKSKECLLKTQGLIFTFSLCNDISESLIIFKDIFLKNVFDFISIFFFFKCLDSFHRFHILHVLFLAQWTISGFTLLRFIPVAKVNFHSPLLCPVKQPKKKSNHWIYSPCLGEEQQK